MQNSPEAMPARLSAPMPGSRSRPVHTIHTIGRQLRFGFQVGPLHLLLPLNTLSEVVPQAVIYPLPRVPRWFLGLLNQRSHLLPVFNLHDFLGTDDRPPRQYNVLVLEQGSDAVGLRIDALPQSVALEEPLPHVPALPAALAAHVSTAYSSAGTIWCDFDHRGFFTSTGARVVQESPSP